MTEEANSKREADLDKYEAEYGPSKAISDEDKRAGKLPTNIHSSHGSQQLMAARKTEAVRLENACEHGKRVEITMGS